VLFLCDAIQDSFGEDLPPLFGKYINKVIPRKGKTRSQMNDIPLIPRTTLFGNPERISPKISPNGKMLAYQAPLNGVLNVYVRSTDPSDQPIPVTSDAIRGIPAYFWQQDSTHILYVQDSGGDENGRLYQNPYRDTRNT